MDEIPFLREAENQWRSGNALEAGRLIFENIDPKLQPLWASSLLQYSVSQTKETSRHIARVIDLAQNPADWKKGHKVFDRLRDVILSLESRKGPTQKQIVERRQFLLAESVAKVVYNASDPDDPFDEDSGHWLVACLRDTLEATGNQNSLDEVWRLVSAGGRKV